MEGNPNWWSMGAIITQAQQPSIYPPQSWSQLLTGGSESEENCLGIVNHFHHQQHNKKLGNWEDHHQTFNPSLRVPVDDVFKRQKLYGHGDDDFDQFRTCSSIRPPWSSPSPRSLLTTTSFDTNMLDFSKSKPADYHAKNQRQAHHSSEPKSTAPVHKKARVPSSSTQLLNVRKEKLVDRVRTLHQLVSPFGKTDTASVLSEAIAHIRFLHAQIEALSSPYRPSNSSANTRHQHSGERDTPEDLTSRGLCLVPISSTYLVGDDNVGSDFWNPALEGGF